MNDKDLKKNSKIFSKNVFAEGVDYYFENGLMVLTRHFLLKRGYCCNNGCRHCPYSDKDSGKLQQKGF